MCYCKNIEMGSYDSQIPMWYDARKRVVGIDICLALEIKSLWAKGITTIECCCGHNKVPGYIIVDDYDMEAMHQLDYEFGITESGTPIYTPKTVYPNSIDEIASALQNVLEHGGNDGSFFLKFDSVDENNNFILDLVSALKINLTKKGDENET